MNDLIDKTPEWQANFVTELMKAIQETILDQIKAGIIPTEWDGIELRALIAYHADRAVFHDLLAGKRKRDFKNTILINDL